eukprot:gene255-129_t
MHSICTAAHRSNSNSHYSTTASSAGSPPLEQQLPGGSPIHIEKGAPDLPLFALVVDDTGTGVPVDSPRIFLSTSPDPEHLDRTDQRKGGVQNPPTVLQNAHQPQAYATSTGGANHTYSTAPRVSVMHRKGAGGSGGAESVPTSMVAKRNSKKRGGPANDDLMPLVSKDAFSHTICTTRPSALMEHTTRTSEMSGGGRPSAPTSADGGRPQNTSSNYNNTDTRLQHPPPLTAVPRSMLPTTSTLHEPAPAQQQGVSPLLLHLDDNSSVFPAGGEGCLASERCDTACGPAPHPVPPDLHLATTTTGDASATEPSVHPPRFSATTPMSSSRHVGELNSSSTSTKPTSRQGDTLVGGEDAPPFRAHMHHLRPTSRADQVLSGNGSGRGNRGEEEQEVGQPLRVGDGVKARAGYKCSPLPSTSTPGPARERRVGPLPPSLRRRSSMAHALSHPSGGSSSSQQNNRSGNDANADGVEEGQQTLLCAGGGAGFHSGRIPHTHQMNSSNSALLPHGAGYQPTLNKNNNNSHHPPTNSRGEDHSTSMLAVPAPPSPRAAALAGTTPSPTQAGSPSSSSPYLPGPSLNQQSHTTNVWRSGGLNSSTAGPGGASQSAGLPPQDSGATNRDGTTPTPPPPPPSMASSTLTAKNLGIATTLAPLSTTNSRGRSLGAYVVPPEASGAAGDAPQQQQQQPSMCGPAHPPGSATAAIAGAGTSGEGFGGIFYDRNSLSNPTMHIHVTAEEDAGGGGMNFTGVSKVPSVVQIISGVPPVDRPGSSSQLALGSPVSMGLDSPGAMDGGGRDRHTCIPPGTIFMGGDRHRKPSTSTIGGGHSGGGQGSSGSPLQVFEDSEMLLMVGSHFSEATLTGGIASPGDTHRRSNAYAGGSTVNSLLSSSAAMQGGGGSTAEKPIGTTSSCSGNSSSDVGHHHAGHRTRSGGGGGVQAVSSGRALTPTSQSLLHQHQQLYGSAMPLTMKDGRVSPSPTGLAIPGLGHFTGSEAPRRMSSGGAVTVSPSGMSDAAAAAARMNSDVGSQSLDCAFMVHQALFAQHSIPATEDGGSLQQIPSSQSISQQNMSRGTAATNLTTNNSTSVSSKPSAQLLSTTGQQMSQSAYKASSPALPAPPSGGELTAMASAGHHGKPSHATTTPPPVPPSRPGPPPLQAEEFSLRSSKRPSHSHSRSRSSAVNTSPRPNAADGVGGAISTTEEVGFGASSTAMSRSALPGTLPSPGAPPSGASVTAGPQFAPASAAEQKSGSNLLRAASKMGSFDSPSSSTGGVPTEEGCCYRVLPSTSGVRSVNSNGSTPTQSTSSRRSVVLYPPAKLLLSSHSTRTAAAQSSRQNSNGSLLGMVGQSSNNPSDTGRELPIGGPGSMQHLVVPLHRARSGSLTDGDPSSCSPVMHNNDASSASTLLPRPPAPPPLGSGGSGDLRSPVTARGASAGSSAFAPFTHGPSSPAQQSGSTTSTLAPVSSHHSYTMNGVPVCAPTWKQESAATPRPGLHTVPATGSRGGYVYPGPAPARISILRSKRRQRLRRRDAVHRQRRLLSLPATPKPKPNPRRGYAAQRSSPQRRRGGTKDLGSGGRGSKNSPRLQAGSPPSLEVFIGSGGVAPVPLRRAFVDEDDEEDEDDAGGNWRNIPVAGAMDGDGASPLGSPGASFGGRPSAPPRVTPAASGSGIGLHGTNALCPPGGHMNRHPSPSGAGHPTPTSLSSVVGGNGSGPRLLEAALPPSPSPSAAAALAKKRTSGMAAGADAFSASGNNMAARMSGGSALAAAGGASLGTNGKEAAGGGASSSAGGVTNTTVTNGLGGSLSPGASGTSGGSGARAIPTFLTAHQYVRRHDNCCFRLLHNFALLRVLATVLQMIIVALAGVVVGLSADVWKPDDDEVEYSESKMLAVHSLLIVSGVFFFLSNWCCFWWIQRKRRRLVDAALRPMPRDREPCRAGTGASTRRHSRLGPGVVGVACGMPVVAAASGPSGTAATAWGSTWRGHRPAAQWIPHRRRRRAALVEHFPVQYQRTQPPSPPAGRRGSVQRGPPHHPQFSHHHTHFGSTTNHNDSEVPSVHFPPEAGESQSNSHGTPSEGRSREFAPGGAAFSRSTEDARRSTWQQRMKFTAFESAAPANANGSGEWEDAPRAARVLPPRLSYLVGDIEEHAEIPGTLGSSYGDVEAMNTQEGATHQPPYNCILDFLKDLCARCTCCQSPEEDLFDPYFDSTASPHRRHSRRGRRSASFASTSSMSLRSNSSGSERSSSSSSGSRSSSSNSSSGSSRSRHSTTGHRQASPAAHRGSRSFTVLYTENANANTAAAAAAAEQSSASPQCLTSREVSRPTGGHRSASASGGGGASRPGGQPQRLRSPGIPQQSSQLHRESLSAQQGGAHDTTAVLLKKTKSREKEHAAIIVITAIAIIAGATRRRISRTPRRPPLSSQLRALCDMPSIICLLRILNLLFVVILLLLSVTNCVDALVRYLMLSPMGYVWDSNLKLDDNFMCEKIQIEQECSGYTTLCDSSAFSDYKAAHAIMCPFCTDQSNQLIISRFDTTCEERFIDKRIELITTFAVLLCTMMVVTVLAVLIFTSALLSGAWIQIYFTKIRQCLCLPSRPESGRAERFMLSVPKHSFDVIPGVLIVLLFVQRVLFFFMFFCLFVCLLFYTHLYLYVLSCETLSMLVVCVHACMCFFLFVLFGGVAPRWNAETENEREIDQTQVPCQIHSSGTTYILLTNGRPLLLIVMADLATTAHSSFFFLSSHLSFVVLVIYIFILCFMLFIYI